jgi:hypothetical protein
VIKHLLEDRQYITLYYYFNFRDAATQGCENFIRSLVFQLLYCLPHVPDVLRDLYDSHASGARRPSVEELTECLIAIITTQQEIRLVGDAFDECTEWNQLWAFLSEIVRRKCPALRFLFTSRPGQAIQDAVRSLEIPSFDLRTSGIDSDIAKFVKEALENDIRFMRILPEGKNDVRHSLISRANRMFVSLAIAFRLFPDVRQVPLGRSTARRHFKMPKHESSQKISLNPPADFG